MTSSPSILSIGRLACVVFLSSCKNPDARSLRDCKDYSCMQTFFSDSVVWNWNEGNFAGAFFTRNAKLDTAFPFHDFIPDSLNRDRTKGNRIVFNLRSPYFQEKNYIVGSIEFAFNERGLVDRISGKGLTRGEHFYMNENEKTGFDYEEMKLKDTNGVIGIRSRLPEYIEGQVRDTSL